MTKIRLRLFILFLLTSYIIHLTFPSRWFQLESEPTYSRPVSQSMSFAQCRHTLRIPHSRSTISKGVGRINNKNPCIPTLRYAYLNLIPWKKCFNMGPYFFISALFMLRASLLKRENVPSLFCFQTCTCTIPFENFLPSFWFVWLWLQSKSRNSFWPI